MMRPKYKNSLYKYTLKKTTGVISNTVSAFVKTPFFGVIFLFLAFAVIGANISAHSVSAQAGNNGGNVTMNADTPPNTRAQSYTYWKLASKCVQSHMRNAIKTSPGSNGATTPKQSGAGGGVGTDAGEWFDDNAAFGQVYPDGQLTCAQVMQKAIQLWGWSSGQEFLKSMGYTFNANVPQWESPSQDGNVRFERFKDAVLGKVGNVVALATDDAMHLLYLNAFKGADPYCQGKQVVKYDSADQTQKGWADSGTVRNGLKYAKITQVEGGSTVAYIYTYTSEPNAVGQLWRYRGAGYGHDGVVEQYSCADLVSRINSSAAALAGWNSNPAHAQTPVGSDSTPTSPGTEPEGGETSCVIEAVGWLVCPVVNFLAGLADGAFGFLANTFLRTDPSAFNTDTPTYRAWIIMRNIANILFVIAFLFIIFSQLTGSGISNYGIKKMLPRLVVAAILVNISFFISQIAIDISNILGYSINNVFEGITGQVMGDTYSMTASQTTTGNTFTEVSVALLAGAATGIALYALLSTFIPVIVAAVLALILMLFILIARQAIIILLVVLSPVAFVALLFPNTEKLFKQWRKMLTAMLLLFPIIALVFGASQLASAVLQGAFTGAYNGEGSNWFGQIVASAVLVIPLFIVPVLLKKSLDGIPMVGQMANKWQSKANGKLSGRLKDSYKGSRFARGAAIRKQGRENYRSKKYYKGLAKEGKMGQFNRILSSGVPITPAQIAGNKALTKTAAAANLKISAEERDDAKKLIESYNLSGSERQQLAMTGSLDVRRKDKNGKEISVAVLKGDVMQQSAIEVQLEGGGGYGDVEAILKQSHKADPATGRAAGTLGKFSQAISQSAIKGGVASKDPALTGPRYDQLAQGTFDYDKAIVSAIGEGRYTAKTFATMNDSARSSVIRVATQEAQAGRPQHLQSLLKATQGIENSPEIYADVAGNSAALSHLQEVKSLAQQFNISAPNGNGGPAQAAGAAAGARPQPTAQQAQGAARAAGAAQPVVGASQQANAAANPVQPAAQPANVGPGQTPPSSAGQAAQTPQAGQASAPGSRRAQRAQAAPDGTQGFTVIPHSPSSQPPSTPNTTNNPPTNSNP